MEARVQVELLNRERWEKVVQWENTIRAIGYFLGHKPDAVQGLVDMLKTQLTDRMFHRSYDMSNVRSQLVKRLNSLSEQTSHIDRLENMTV